MRININGTWRTISRGVFNINGVWKSISRGVININGIWRSFWSGGGPSQLTRPTLSGTGAAFTNISRTSGTYTGYTSITTRIFSTTDDTPLDDGLTTAATGTLTSSNPYTITQSDATPPPYIFYARDDVLGTNGTTHYYYYSEPKTAYISSITDNFNRTVSSGLGTASGGFIYNGPSRNGSSWSVNGSRANNNSNGSGYPLQTVELNSNNQSVSLNTFGGGLGAAVWVNSSNSWWAVIPTYSYEIGQGTDYTCTSTKYGSEEECNAVTYVSGGSNPQSTGYMISDVGKRCTACTTSSTSYNYECTNNVRVTNAGDPCPEYESWSSAMPGGENTVCSGSCTESYEYVCTSEWALNQPDCSNELIRADPTGPNQLCACQSYSEIVAICPSNYNNSGPCSDSNYGGSAIGDQCSYCNVSTSYAYSYRNSYQSTRYDCTGSSSCSGQNCCDSLGTPRSDPTGPGQYCGNCQETPSTSTTYSYSIRASTGTTIYSCTGSTVTGAATCPTYRPDPTGSGQNCSGCTPSTSTTYGSCKTPGPNDPSGCVRAPAGYTACAIGLVRCPSTTTTYSYKLSAGTTTYLCDVPVTGAGNCPSPLPALGSGPGQRCTSCTTNTNTTYSSTYTVSVGTTEYACQNYTSGQASCPGEGSGAGQRCGACYSTTTSLYKTRIGEEQTRWKTKTSSTLTYNNYKTRKYLGSVIEKTWKEVEETTGDAYTYNANINIYSYSSGTLTLRSTAIVSSYAAQVGSEFSNDLYPDITTISATTSGNSISGSGWVGSQSNTTSATNSGTKGNSVGVVGIPTSENIGTQLDNFSA